MHIDSYTDEVREIEEELSDENRLVVTRHTIFVRDFFPYPSHVHVSVIRQHVKHEFLTYARSHVILFTDIHTARVAGFLSVNPNCYQQSIPRDCR